MNQKTMNQEIETANADVNASDNVDVQMTILTDEELGTIVGGGTPGLGLE